ncbi:CPBP family glutamic-type intramembrane protease [Myxococcota bacterium]|nr:CPBP family glutamic-type intramembrane protease [Myxococcota bacterium]
MTLLPPAAVAAAALIALPWALLVLGLGLAAPATASHLAASDPLLHLLPPGWGPLVVPALALWTAVSWARVARPARAVLGREAAKAAVGILSAGLIVGAVRLLGGPTPPPLVPTEETLAPGLLLGLTAGLGEELLFRLSLVPPLFWALERRLPRMPAVALTALITGLVFTAAHALAGPTPVATWHLSRLLLPGMLMTFAFLRLGPSFLITAHCAAHLWIPTLYRS